MKNDPESYQDMVVKGTLTQYLNEVAESAEEDMRDRTAASVVRALNVLERSMGAEKFSKVFRTITTMAWNFPTFAAWKSLCCARASHGLRSTTAMPIAAASAAATRMQTS